MKILKILLCVLFSNSVLTQTFHWGYPDPELKGRIMSVLTIQYEAFDTNGTIQKGRIINNTIRDMDDSGHKLATFNRKGFLISIEFYDTLSAIFCTYTYQYEDNKIISMYKEFIGWPKFLTNKYAYDKEQNLVRDTTLQGNGDVFSLYKYTYDEHNQEVDFKSYSGDTLLDNHFTYKYDDYGNKTEFRVHPLPSWGSYFILWEYDEKGKETKLEWFKEDESLWFYSLYDYQDDGEIVIRKTYSLDGSNKVSVDRTEFEFDQNGNWIRKTKFDEGIAISITERTIEYFK